VTVITSAGDRELRAPREEANFTRLVSACPEPPDREAAMMRGILGGMSLDPDIFRAYLEIRLVLAPQREVLARPGFAEHVGAVAASLPPDPPKLGPDRAELLKMIA
jgi:hypothetical protein